MVLLETFAVSSMYATVAGVHLRTEYLNLLRGRPMKARTAGREPDLICKLENDKTKFIGLLASKMEFDPPMYLNTPNHYGGLSVPMGGGFSVEEEFVYKTMYTPDEEHSKDWLITDFGTPYSFKTDPDVKRDVMYMNTLSQLQVYLDENKIENTQFPIRLPMKVIEVKPGKGKPTYFANNYKIAGSNMDAVAFLTMINRNRTLYKSTRAAIYLTALCGACIALDWRNQSYKLATYIAN